MIEKPRFEKELGIDLKIIEGISEEQIQQLIEYSNTDEAVRQFTSDATRFADRLAFDEWLSQGKEIYTLGNDKGYLLGIIWFSNRRFDEFPYSFDKTFAIRMYELARGKGLAYDFAEAVIEDYLENHQVGGIWLETSLDNTPAVKLYNKLGFVPVTSVDEQTNRFKMVKYR